MQLPAFLVRQTDLVVAAAKAVARNGGWLHAKKAQFLAPWDCANIISKVREAAPDLPVILCERGSSFGYNNLTVDMLAIPEMHKLGVPVTIDATHAVQLPGADPRTAGASTGGRRDGVPVLAKRLWRPVPTEFFWSFIRAPMRPCATLQAVCRLMPRALLSTLKDCTQLCKADFAHPQAVAKATLVLRGKSRQHALTNEIINQVPFCLSLHF